MIKIYKKIELYKVIRLLLNKKKLLFLEIGAHIGKDTINFLKFFPEIKLYCFEPDPRNIEIHKKIIHDPRCVLIEKAIFSSNRRKILYQSYGKIKDYGEPWGILDFTYSSSLKIPKNHLFRAPLCKFNDGIMVETITLDEWSKDQNIDEIDFIWADVQGAEKELIEGGIETLKKTKYFYTEYCNNEDYLEQINLERIELLLPDYEILLFYNDNVLFVNKKLNNMEKINKIWI